MLINKFAKAYDPSTAANTPGIILMTEDKDIQTPQPKSTVEEVYTQILKDINEAIDLGGLPDVAVNKMRLCKPAAYAIKALTLLNMQNGMRLKKLLSKLWLSMALSTTITMPIKEQLKVT